MSSWKGILPTHETLRAMSVEDLDAVVKSSANNIHTLAHGVSAIGNLLAGAASNTDTGLNLDAVSNIGYLLGSIGGLISNLVDAEDNAKHYRKERGAAQ